MMFDGHATEDSFRREVRNGWREDRFEEIEKREFGGDRFDIALDKVADPYRRSSVLHGACSKSKCRCGLVRQCPFWSAADPTETSCRRGAGRSPKSGLKPFREL